MCTKTSESNSLSVSVIPVTALAQLMEPWRFFEFFLKHHTLVIHFGIMHFKNEEILFYSAGPISRSISEDVFE